VGLHLRYAEIFGKELSVSSMCLSKNEEEIEAIARKWASVISDKYVRQQAEEAARIALRHGIKDLPELREADLGKISKYHGARASFQAGMTDELPSIIRVNKRGYRGWKEAHANAVRYGQLVQDNPLLHELGHYIDYCNDSANYRKLEHTWKVENVDEALVKKHLSTYALSDYAEFEAELNAAIMRGKVLPKELLSYSHMNQVDTPLAKRMLSLASGDSVCLPNEEVCKGFKDAMKVLFHQKGSSFSIDILADKNVQGLIEAHTSVLDRNLQRLEMSDLMRQRLTRSNYIFSGIKTFHELNEAFPSLLDSNGNRKTFEAFLNDVRKIDKTYNSNYLRAEYNFVQSSAEMAAKWERFSEDGDRYNLQYRTANDSKVRPEHAALNGVTLPPSDPFWEEYYPPNGWNCRCTVVQVRKSKHPATPHEEAMALGVEALQRDTKGIFHFNPGKQNKTVPDYNPYTIRRCRDCDIAKGKIKLARFVPENELCSACKLIHSCWAKVKEETPETFTECETSNGKLRVSSKHGKTEKKENVRVGRYLAEKHGYEIDLIANPQNETSADSFNKTLGIEQEYKVNATPTGNSIDNLIRKGAKQAHDLVLFVDSGISLDELSNALNNRVRRTNLKTVMVVINGMDKTYTYDEITANGFKIRQADLK
jgi:SPP1 gp7 family putative phage head morphogenesis protein